MRRSIFMAALATLFVSSAPVAAAPIVTYTIGGSANAWLLDFSVTNTLGIPDHQIYFFGVELPDRDIVGSPDEWDPDLWPSWINTDYGGSDRTYNNTWNFFGDVPEITEPEIGMGETLGGFVARVTTETAPSSVNWFAFSFGQTSYLESDAFYITTNPGFEGVATATVSEIPEPATVILVSLGLAGCWRERRVRAGLIGRAGAQRKRRKSGA